MTWGMQAFMACAFEKPCLLNLLDVYVCLLIVPQRPFRVDLMQGAILLQLSACSINLWQKFRTPFSTELQNELEQFYLDRYSMWFSQGLFGLANSQIPMINIWDDHDIIDVSKLCTLCDDNTK